ncbi:flavin reductase [Pseudoclavibacter sp. CFCC 13796]|uniref:flavin reductase n=1 Tax=Pseudoclavibacter sp. CFCC 13796 TaxID=2615179 RepID=UPI001300DDCA|nr:flavin reductase [Pseudoclavibacter sp. CFCC 13796]KAB1660851.1 flavin reductase [Pseudoclavibacter sp. CFCC 13796]
MRENIIQAWIDAWDTGDFGALEQLTDPEYQRVSSRSGAVSDFDALKRDIQETRAAFPGLRTEVEHVVGDDEELAIFWRTVGVFSEPLAGIPPTGNSVVTRGSNYVHVRDGRILSEEVTWDQSALLADVGVPSLNSAFEKVPEDVVVDDLSGQIDLNAFKGFNRKFVTGVTVVTAIDAAGQPRGLAANSYASVSVEPPLVLVCVQKTSSTYATLFGAKYLGINILSNGQRETVGTFAGKSADKFAGIDWHPAPQGSPMIAGSSASIEAEIKERFQAKTHTVFIARVRYTESSDAGPMIYKAGHFFDSDQLTEL